MGRRVNINKLWKAKHKSLRNSGTAITHPYTCWLRWRNHLASVQMMKIGEI